MKSLYFIVYITLAMACSKNAYAEDVWTCTYPGFPDSRPVIVRYRENSGFLVDDDYRQKYQILQNNQYAVIAVWSFAGIDNNQTGIIAATIIINKATGAFLRENASITEPDTVNRPYRGKCLPN